jgi:predicted esterase
MTREDREHEIRDYVDYLDALVAACTAGAPRRPRVVALGFSQGAATVSRWAALGSTAVDDVLLWGAGVAHDLPLDPATFRGARVLLVAGSADEHLGNGRIAAERQRLHYAGVVHELVEYDGGHRIDADALRRVASLLRA